mmetsp:Transcript_104025/g.184706  ORF Transcript_104025/g.184706 Transcript_104025/m.184706 type:complete len:234 (-) Transcript_104025:2672-3373(-)
MAADTRILQNGIRTQELRQPTSRCHLDGLVIATVFDRFAHGLRLGEEMDDLVIGHSRSFRLDDIKPAVGHGTNNLPDLFFCCALEELWEDLCLENLDEAKLTSSLHLEAFELCQRPIELVDRIALLQHLVFFSTSWKDHCLVRAINLEQDGILARGLPLSSRWIPLLVLVVRVLLVHAVVEHTVWVRHLQLFAALELVFEDIRKLLGQKAPDPVSVQLQWKADLLAELTCLSN